MRVYKTHDRSGDEHPELQSRPLAFDDAAAGNGTGSKEAGIHLATRGDVNDAAFRQGLVEEMDAIKKKVNAERMMLGTYKLYVSLRASRGLNNKPIPAVVHVDLCGRATSHDMDTTTFFCIRQDKAKATPKEMQRGPGEWRYEMHPMGCGGTIHPDHYRDSATKMTCPHCGLRSFPKALRATLVYRQELPQIAETVARHLQLLKLDASLVVELWKADRFTDARLDPYNLRKYDGSEDHLDASRRVAIYRAATLIKDSGATEEGLVGSVLRILNG